MDTVKAEGINALRQALSRHPPVYAKDRLWEKKEDVMQKERACLHSAANLQIAL